MVTDRELGRAAVGLVSPQPVLQGFLTQAKQILSSGMWELNLANMLQREHAIVTASMS